MDDASPSTGDQATRPPRGALIVVAIGLLACVVAALATAGPGEGEAANLEWVQVSEPVASKPVPIPGGEGEMRLSETRIRATGTNVSGYSLFAVSSQLTMSGGSPIGGGRIVCSVKAPRGTEIARSSGGLRALYPRSAEGGIYNQEVPEVVLMDFSSKGSELAVLEFPDRPRRFTTERGVKLEWPEYRTGTERLKYFVAGKPEEDLVLPFLTIWKTTDIPAAEIGCTVEVSAGTATVSTEASLSKRSPLIDEEAEARKEEEREEAEEEAEEDEG